MGKDDKITLDAEVTEALPNTFFRVELDGGHVVRSGIALGSFVPDAEARRRVRAEFSFPADAKVVVTTANFKPQKNPLMGLAAFARVAAAEPAAEPAAVMERSVYTLRIPSSRLIHFHISICS